MNPWSVNIVTAFGRAENLALALHDKGFYVNLYDLTDAFPSEYRHGTGPFPIIRQAFLGPHESFFDSLTELPKGVAVWPKTGPLEFAGPMAAYFVERDPAFMAAVQDQPQKAFNEDWLRRLLWHWTSPYHFESWGAGSGTRFPVDKPLGLVARPREKLRMSFDRFQGQPNYHRAKGLKDIQIESGQITELEVDVGRPSAVRAPQWVWCLSSQETESIHPPVAETLFSRDIRRAEWLWMSMPGEAERGPWSDGFARSSIVIDDIHLPWTHANMFILEWIDESVFEVWLKVPAEAGRDVSKRTSWAADVERILNNRLSLAKFRVDPMAYKVCPNSPVFPDYMKEWKPPGWKNWDWIAPETLSRLDLSARFEGEVQSFQRLMNWRNDQIKKQGVRGDQALHAP